MSKPLGLIGLTIFAVSLTANGLLAGDVGTSKSFHGPVGLVSPYSLRDLQKAQGLAAALDKIRGFGFRYVELGTDFGGLEPAAFKAELNRRGLVPVGQHLSYERIRDDVEGVAAAAKVLNLSRIGCAWIPHKDPFDEKQCRTAAAVFNRAGAALAKHGIQLYYHTHGYEFRPFGQGNVGADKDITISRRVKDQKIGNVVARQYKRRLDDQFVLYYDLIDYDETFYYEEELVSGKPVPAKIEVERQFDSNVVLWGEGEPPKGWTSNEVGAYVDLHNVAGRVERVDQGHVKYFLDLKPGKKQAVTYSVTYKRRKVGPELNTERKREPL